jgi:hypothetical protein
MYRRPGLSTVRLTEPRVVNKRYDRTNGDDHSRLLDDLTARTPMTCLRRC